MCVPDHRTDVLRWHRGPGSMRGDPRARSVTRVCATLAVCSALAGSAAGAGRALAKDAATAADVSPSGPPTSPAPTSPAPASPREAWPLLFDPGETVDDHRFSLNLRDLTVAEALRFSLAGTGLQLVDEDTLSMPARGSLDSVTVAEAVDALTRLHDLTWRVEGAQLIVSRREEATFHLGFLTEPEAAFWTDLETNLKALQSADGQVVLHARSGTIHVIDRPSVVRRIGGFVASIDRDLGRQVNIEAKLVEVELEDGMETGVDWAAFAHGWDGFAGNTASGGLAELTTASGAGVLQLGLIRTGRLEVLLEMLETRGQVRVLSRPRLAAMGNEPAVFRVTENIPYYVQDVFTTQGSDPYIQYRLEFREAGVVMEVLAHVAADGGITLKVHPSVSALTGYTAALPNLPPQPIVDLRETKTTVRMRPGETLAIGGLIHEREESGSRGVPLLGRLPVLGALFRREATSTKKQELMILLTPAVLADQVQVMRGDRSRCLRWTRAFSAATPRERLAAHAHARGVQAYLAGGTPDAIAWGRRAVALAPAWADARFNLGLYLAASGEAGEARTMWRELALAPETALAAEANLQALALWEGEPPVDPAARFVPPSGAEPAVLAALALNEASRLSSLGKGPEAREVMEKAAAALPRQAEPWRRLLQRALRE